ncbi:MAG: hypothetical protein DME44_04355, partial [Verrucomicrobia bacterium]
DGQHQPKSDGAAKNECFHSFHLPMRCRKKPLRIQENETEFALNRSLGWHAAPQSVALPGRLENAPW